MIFPLHAGADSISPGLENYDPQLLESSIGAHSDSHCEIGIVDDQDTPVARKDPASDSSISGKGQQEPDRAVDAHDDNYHDALENVSITGAVMLIYIDVGVGVEPLTALIARALLVTLSCVPTHIVSIPKQFCV